MKVSVFDCTRRFVSFALACVLASLGFSATHTVGKGETYYSISKKYGISVDQLCSANGLTKNDVLKIGQNLVIPDSENSISRDKTSPSVSLNERKFDSYTVQKGDTFYRIAKINGITVAELKKLNNLSDDSNALKIGQKLKIPVTIVDTSKATLPDLPSKDPRNYSTKKGDSKLTWPVKNPTVTYTNGKVSGVQLSAQKNESVNTVRAGTVMYVGNYRGYGQVVFVQSLADYIYVYSGLSAIRVKKGDYVDFGDSIGIAGTDSIKGTSQVSFMVFQKAKPIDPAKAPRG